MKINEIFYSLEGEGKRVGQPCVFIRRSGCNLHCVYDGKDCDTPYRDEGVEMSVAEIMKKVNSFGCMNVTLTGGEPLLPHKDLDRLREVLHGRGYEVNIETNGSMSTESRFSNEFFTVDYKCGCSGMTDKMNPLAFRYLRWGDVIKFVVSDEDFDQVRKVVKDIKDGTFWILGEPMVYLSPCYGRCDLEKLAELVKEVSKIYPNNRVGMSLQTHKIIWGAERRGV